MPNNPKVKPSNLNARVLLLTAIGLSIALLVRFSYLIGWQVGRTDTRTEAIENHCGYVDYTGWHWITENHKAKYEP